MMSAVLPDIIDSDELLTRYIFHQALFNPNTGTVKPTVFTPHKDRNDLSVYRITGCSEPEIWELANNFVKPKDKTTLARADTQAESYYKAGLRIVSLKTPHIRHANVENWPLDRDDRNEIRRQLSEASRLYVK